MPRSRTLALSRQTEAVALRREGHTFDQIATKVGYANRGTAYRVVKAAFETRIAADIDEHRAMEVARLDALQSEMWDVLDSATKPEQRVSATSMILKIVQARSKLLGLYDNPAEPARMLIDPSLSNPGKATSV